MCDENQIELTQDELDGTVVIASKDASDRMSVCIRSRDENGNYHYDRTTLAAVYVREVASNAAPYEDFSTVGVKDFLKSVTLAIFRGYLNLEISRKGRHEVSLTLRKLILMVCEAARKAFLACDSIIGFDDYDSSIIEIVFEYAQDTDSEPAWVKSLKLVLPSSGTGCEICLTDSLGERHEAVMAILDNCLS